MFAKLGAVIFVAAMLVVAQRLGLFRSGRRAGAPQAKRSLALGPWGYVAFVVAYAALQPFGVPGTVFIIAAPLIWPWPVAFALSMAGTMAASVVGFSFARFVARDWVAKRIPARFREYDEALERSAASRPCSCCASSSGCRRCSTPSSASRKVRFWTHFWGSVVGYLVPLFS